MSRIFLQSYAAGKWLPPSGTVSELKSAVTGKVVAELGTSGLDFGAMANHAREVGGHVLRRTTFHERAALLKALAQYLNERRETLYELSYDTGATKADAMIDIDGGISTLFVYASKGRRELPDDIILTEGALERLSRSWRLRRPACRNITAGRRHSHQRLQLSCLGHAGKAGADFAGWCAGHCKTGLGDGLGGGSLFQNDR